MSVNIEVLYNDHDHQLILVVANLAKGREVSQAWTRDTGTEVSGGSDTGD